jgi:hypothetical protein
MGSSLWGIQTGRNNLIRTGLFSICRLFLISKQFDENRVPIILEVFFSKIMLALFAHFLIKMLFQLNWSYLRFALI